MRSVSDKRNFLFFFNNVYPWTFDNSLTAALAKPASWRKIAKMVNTARQENAFARSIKKIHLYIHIPFCEKLCSFCHCSRVLFRGSSKVDEYIKNLAVQMAYLAPLYNGMDVGMLNFGGGTPSVLDERQLISILDLVEMKFPARQRKILFEANPSSLTASKLAILNDRGLFRLSMGVQTLDEKVLRNFSCSHTAKNVFWCLRSARKIGVPHINVDIIAGLPGQTTEGLIRDIRIVIAEGANVIHVQPYSDLQWRRLCAPGETVFEFIKRRDAMMREAIATLRKEGFRHVGLEGTYTSDGQGHGHYHEEVFFRLEAALAGFGIFAKGQFPGTVYYRSGSSVSVDDSSLVDVSTQDFNYVTAQYAWTSLFDGLDERVFFQRFGVSLDQCCGEGLRFLRREGLLSFHKGVWKFCGEWKVSKLYELFVLAKVLFGEAFIARLRRRYNHYDAKKDYSGNKIALNAYANYCLMNLYYQRCV